ncbi:MAG: helix-turn-helix transcriptional regulator [Acidobacteriaceae bacterium]|nr:helix-turn-helix transcriptional regulator [Acidobacteriaceae bacterium]
MQRTSLTKNPCPVARALDSIGDWWSLLIIRDAFDGVRRFGDFQRSLGVAKNILTARLRRLVADGILALEASSDGTPYQEYVLTAKGEDLFPVIVALRQWGEAHFYRKNERHSVLVDRHDNKRVQKIQVLSSNGKLLSPSETLVKKPSALE